MYRINVLTSGKYDNVVTGPRYVLTKRKAFNLAKMFIEVNCEIECAKFVRLCDGVYAWSDSDKYGSYLVQLLALHVEQETIKEGN